MIDFGNLLRFIELEDGRLKRCYFGDDTEKIILARTVKLGEEFGELCNEVLSYYSLQRKQKLDSHHSESLSEEFADVVITTLLLAKSIGIDLERALQVKIEKVNNRYKEGT